MEFMSRGGRDAAPQPPAGHPGQHVAHSPRRGGLGAKTVRIETFIVLVGSALVLLALILYLVFGGSGTTEAKNIQNDKYQAVFLNGGSTSGSVAYTTYFGHITGMNDKYLVLKDVYYLTTAQTTGNQQANPQLTKLGCQQLHSPYDFMYINRNQIAFWENLRDDGKVVQAIKEFQKQNPNGPNCNATSGGTQNPQGTQAPAASGNQ